MSPFFPATVPGWVFALAWFSYEIRMVAFTDARALPIVLAHYAIFVMFRAVYFKPRAV